ncbi:glycoside hydrolase family 5 protein [Athelia psychrophila]|uniref:glucan 1,3-beta-glucosidase n=1 Tax=Athelia psychrophila TaxID=1759441 RepID=A0A165XYX1_9AGAM|nr:glycoside hydrolase family 5 protein [Fibularhizoctonia sp. CBS 109695]
MSDHNQAMDSDAPGTPMRETHTPLPMGDSGLEPPRASFFDPQSSTSTPRDSVVASSMNDSSHRLSEGLLVQGEDGATSDQHDRELVPAGAQEENGKKRSSRKMLLGLAALGALIVVVLVVILPVYFTVIKKHNSSASSSGGGGATGAGGGGGGSPGSSPGSKAAITGGDGSTITMDNGSNFTYSNAFGGSWYYDPEDPFNNNAQVNSWTPPLNTSWNFSTDQIRGVNIGGLFVLEPFISPALFQAYPDAIDEWSLSEAIAANTSTTLQAVLEDHYNTFITEEDIAQIAGAGLNWIRVPIPYWAIETWEGEPFLEGVSWKYIVRLLGWARKYGLRVNLDLHTIPGSQNASFG